MPHSLSHPLKTKLTGQTFCRDPWSTYARLREAGPIVPLKLPIIGRIWITTTYEATERVLKDNGGFVLEGSNAGRKGIAGFQWWMPRSLRRLADNMLAKDDPDHKRLRKLVDRAFARHNIQAMRPSIEARCARLLDALPRDQPVDLVEAYARRLPMQVICDLLGLPEGDTAKFAEWGRSITAVKRPLDFFRFLPALKKLTSYIETRIEVARAGDERNAPHGLIQRLVEAEADGERLSQNELVSMIFLLLVAGFETTTNLISGAVLDLEHNADQKAWLLADCDARIERGVEELARHVSSIQGTKPRFAARDCTLLDQPLRRGDLIMALPGAANADPAVFEAPERLRLDRFPNPHMVFSTGSHFCLGQQLARVETQAALQQLYGRFPDLQLCDETPDYARRIGHRALNSLRVSLA
ncbi:MAG: cytochrome P450 [Ahrensia sp.]|nr:cytochrome P450 [Ahrensia sp.]